MTTATTITSPPFRIKDSESDVTTTTEEEEESTTDGIPATTVTNRVVIGRSPDDWFCTITKDWSTLTFTEVFKIFRESIFDLQKTSLVVNRMISHTQRPEQFRFSEGALLVLREPNAGGASEFSEAFSFELFHRVFQAELVKTEMKVSYEWGAFSKKTDYTMNLGGHILAVSVTRALKFRGIFTEDDAFNLLYKKLAGIQMSNRDVCEEDRWTKQILHIMTEHVYIVELLRSVYSWMHHHQPELIGSTVVMITHTQNAPFLYYNFCAEQANMVFTDTAANDTNSLLSERVDTFTTAARCDTVRSSSLFEKARVRSYAMRRSVPCRLAFGIQSRIQQSRLRQIAPKVALGVKNANGIKSPLSPEGEGILNIASHCGRLEEEAYIDIERGMAIGWLNISAHQFPSQPRDELQLYPIIELSHDIVEGDINDSPSRSSSSSCFPPLREPLHNMFLGTFTALPSSMAWTFKRAEALPAKVKPIESFTPWSFSNVRGNKEKQEECKDQGCQAYRNDQGDSGDGSDIGLAAMFEESNAN